MLRKEGCKFYQQFNSYIASDVIVFNALKYKLEFAIGRKPLTEVEIIDEGDDFLDSFVSLSPRVNGKPALSLNHHQKNQNDK